tara:strand:+ start:25 stop:477 length:453 start_codon:yes stop_codon:yes gene_type:complete
MTKALIGAGCFWGIEEYFRKINGIMDTKVGYSGGHTKNPTYEEVCLGSTNHAEVVQIEFDEKLINYEKILDHFWECHDPTQLNRQGYDIGSQYRSVIYYYSEVQQNLAEGSKNKKQTTLNNKIVTEISKATNFFLAEEYHQLYIQKKSLS